MQWHRSLLVCLVLAFTAAGAGHAASLKLVEEGVQISAGSLGEFRLSYPEFTGSGDKKIHPATGSVLVEGARVVRYQGGAECHVRIVDQSIHLEFRQVPAEVQKWRMSLLIDIGFARGGTWQMGDQEGAFPMEKPAVPQIASRNATAFAFRNGQGQRLSFTVPPHSFQQLTDNREWNWAVFHWQFFAPTGPDKTSAEVRITSDLKATGKLVDAFGQSKAAQYPAKVQHLDELRADVAADEAYYASIRPPALDAFGGWPGSRERLGLQRTGFFHLERSGPGGNWWLADPEGNAFFHLGVCGFAPNDDYTYVKGREDIYEWLPQPAGEFASAFRPGDGGAHFSFYLANWIRKFGEPYAPDPYAARMIQRVRKWGFNSIGAFSPTPPSAHVQASFPYVAHLPLNEWEGVARIPGAHEVWDPYDPGTERKIAENLARELPGRARDPLLIGWFIVNEPRYDELPRVIPSLPGKHGCKQAFVSRLRDKYHDVASWGAAWKGNAGSFDELLDRPLEVSTAEARADVDAFEAEFLEKMFQQVEQHFRRHDPSHLLLGCRLQPVTIDNESLCRIMGRHVDVVSYNYYTYGVDREALRRFHRWCGEKPFLLSEFFWSSPPDSGLIGGRELKSQQERGLAYRNYVEQSASLGFVVGVEWFLLVDQATTGRWFSRYNGESFNTGLLSVTDRPWKDMLAEMMETNHAIYPLLLREREPFTWQDPRFQSP